MKYKINRYKNIKIQNFIKTQRFYFFIFFNIKKQKVNIKMQQSFYNQAYKIRKFNNIYLKKLIKFSVFSNLNSICSSFIYLGNVQNKQISFIEFKKLNICFIIFENKIYNLKQFKTISNINFRNMLFSIYFFLIKNFFIYLKFLEKKHLFSK